MTDITFESLPQSVGHVMHGAPFVLGQAESDHFEKATWLDKAYPDDIEEFPSTLVEGFLLLGMLDAAARLASLDATSTMWGLNYGLDRVRFISPVHLGQTVHSTYETLVVDPKDQGYKVLRRCTFQVEGAESPAMIADWWTFVLPRGTVEKARRDDD